MRNRARDELKRKLPNYVEQITKKSKGGMYICPLCKSGTGENRTGAFSVTEDGESWKCFSCDKSGDIFDLIGAVEGYPDFIEQLKRAEELFGVRTDSAPVEYAHTHESICVDVQEEQKPEEDYRSFFLKANSNLTNTTYHRGISLETLNRFNVGYVENWRHPKAPKASSSPRLIIPTSEQSYLARDTRSEVNEEQRQYSKQKVGKIHFFNAQSLDKATKPIFIVEGELDALSIIEVGGEAVALGSIAMIRKFLQRLESRKPAQTLVLALDNEERGAEAENRLAEGLERLCIPYYKLNPAGGYKDSNEALNMDKDSLERAVRSVKTEEERVREQKKKVYLSTSSRHWIDSFVNGIKDSVNTSATPTGFPELDDVLDGGLYEGLYIVGAISSLGKTTLIAQIADQIAQSGRDVLFFSLEMARSEIMAKSISRHTIIDTLDGGDTRDAKTSRGITRGKRYENYSDIEKDLIHSSINQYKQYAQHIYISEGVGDIGAKEIRETVEAHKLYTGNTPTIIIDYLQILSPYNERYTDKQNTDKAVMELKRISRDFKTPIIGISSFNRANYRRAVTMEAFKESGAIEYSSDVLIGLQLQGAGTKDFDSDSAKKKNPRNIELVILKNRNGRVGDKILFNYYPLFNYFSESEDYNFS